MMIAVIDSWNLQCACYYKEAKALVPMVIHYRSITWNRSPTYRHLYEVYSSLLQGLLKPGPDLTRAPMKGQANAFKDCIPDW
jgi:hypothetical protein